MKKTGMSFALVLSLAACGDSNPFAGGTGGGGGGGGGTPDTGIPTQLSHNLGGATYDAANQTLTVTGLPLEDGPHTGPYQRKAGLDKVGYEAYTAQDGSLDRHSTGYAKDIRGTQAAVVVSGGQFGHFFGGGTYKRNSYSAPVPPTTNTDGGLVSYAGNYVGMLNGPGNPSDLLPVTPGTPGTLVTSQAATVTGQVLINASFADGTVNGRITNRTFDNSVIGAGTNVAEDLDLAPTQITENGTFFGDVEVAKSKKGEYGGVFGGTGATEVAGVVHAEEHINALSQEIEYGIFVLGKCGEPGEDPLCNQPVR